MYLEIGKTLRRLAKAVLIFAYIITAACLVSGVILCFDDILIGGIVIGAGLIWLFFAYLFYAIICGFAQLVDDVNDIKHDVDKIKSGVGEIKSDVDGIKSNVREFKDCVGSAKSSAVVVNDELPDL